MKRLPFEYAVRNLGRSPLRLILSVAGSTLVVLLVLAAAAFARGMEHSLRASGSSSTIMILGAGSEESIERSEIGSSVASLVAAAVPGIRSRAGQAYVSPEVHVQLPVHIARDASTPPADADDAPLALVRGMTPAAFLVHPQVQIVEGSMPRAGYDELMIGDLASTKLSAAPDDLAVGRQVWLAEKLWTITGRFVAPATVMEAELWAPLTDLKLATRRDTDSCVLVSLDTAEFADIDAFCKQRLDLELTAMPESEYYSKLRSFYAPVRAVVWITAALIALGGLFGGLNTMYAAFASRIRELAMLQCLGYSRPALILSLVQESILATAAGGLIGAATGLLVLDGLAVRFSMGAFGLRADAVALSLSLGSALALGLFGALPPAWRCLRLPIPEALKSG